MLIRIDPSNGLAIYEQVVRQIKYAVADGAMREGELAPSVRELARDLAINPNTVTRAYQQLQADEILESIRGTGLAVRKRAVDRCRKQRHQLIQSRLRSVLLEAKQSGLPAQELRDLVESKLSQVLTEETSQ